MSLNKHSQFFFLWPGIISTILLCLPLAPVWADASWERLPTDAEIKTAWENTRAALDREWSGLGKADHFSAVSHLNHFATTVDRPLHIRFHVKNGPRGAYIAGIQSLVLGWDVFHTGKDITDWQADPNTRTVEYAFFGIDWQEALDAARSGTPIAFEAELSVFTGYEGRERVFETVPLRGEMRFAGTEGLPVQLFILERIFEMPPGPLAASKPGEGGVIGRPGGLNNRIATLQSLTKRGGRATDFYTSHAQILLPRDKPDPFDAWDYVCGGWQQKVLDLLATLHDGNATQRAALAAFDYGPIESRWGGHQAVVLYPKGGDWKGGIVLDGWPNQVSEVWTMDLWKWRFGVPLSTWGGIGPSEVYLGQYPMTGGTGYPGSGRAMPPVTHREILRRLPVEVGQKMRKEYGLLAPAERQAFIDQLLEEFPDIENSISIAVESPIRLLITDSENRKVGWDDAETMLYEIPGVHFDEYPKEDGTVGTIVVLPLRDYQVRLTTVQAGKFRYSYGITDVGHFASPFTTVSPGDDFEHQLSASRPNAPLVGSGGVTIPVSATTSEERGILSPTVPGIPTADQIQRLRERAMEVWSPPADPSLDFEERDQPEMPPAGWTKSVHDPTKIVEIFRPLRLKSGYVLRAYTFQEGGNANGIVWAMPETAEFPEPEDCPTLEHHLFQAPKPWGALDDVMEAIEGDGSEWSYLAASLLRRELREFGASWHGIQWGTHYVLEEDPWKKGPPKEDDFDLSRPSNLEREWKWSGPKPMDWAPAVHVQPNQITVTYYSYSGKGTQRIFRHTETYRPGSYRARVQDQEIASGGLGYLF